MSCSRRGFLGALALILASGTLAGVLSACGSTSATLDPVAQAAEVSSAASGVHMNFTMRVSASGLSSPVTVTGSGAFSYTAHEGELAFDMSGLPSSATAALGTGELRFEELVKQNDLYVSSPLLAGHLPGNARWVKVELAKLGGGLNLGGLTSGESNPAQFLEYLRSAGGSVTTVGSETLDGVKTTHYRGSISLTAAAQKLPASERGVFERFRSQTGSRLSPSTSGSTRSSTCAACR